MKGKENAFIYLFVPFSDENRRLINYLNKQRMNGGRGELLDTAHARYLLRTVDEGQAFGFANGKTARNMKELLRGVLSLSSEQYQHHVYTDHNDFANWLLDVIDDELVARDLFHADQRQAGALLRARVHFLEEHAGM